MYWLFEAKKRFGLTILGYMITSNHIHLLVIDDGPSDLISKSMQLIAGRTGQEYNQRKSFSKRIQKKYRDNTSRVFE
jgi:putative transposase